MATSLVSHEQQTQFAPKLTRPAQAPITEPLEENLTELEQRARASFLRGESTLAMRLYRRVIATSPERASAWRGLGLVASATGERNTARDALRRYLELSPHASDRAAVMRELHR
jgi:regulator of sirC expression with transglutaminase-like and TPR domain